MTAREVRFAFIFDDYEAALRLFRDVFGLQTLEDLDHEGARGVILRVPSATLELFDREYGAFVDEIEVGSRLDYRARIAVRVNDLTHASKRVEGSGAVPEAGPVVTPWGDHNRRYRTTDGLQLTLFQSPEQ